MADPQPDPIAARARELAAAAPPLTDEQRARLRALLRQQRSRQA
ncbi:hypothetical protein [Actinomycetospora endophytica]|nr:hypothetical protein [Actinomycetospora endophytica]